MAGTVGLFVPCYVDQLWPRAARAAVELVEALGFEPKVAEAVCCGQVFGNAGELADARRVRELWSRAHHDLGEVVVLSASCAGYLLSTASRPVVREFCDWLAAHAPACFPTPVRRTLALHSSCSALRDTRSAWAARDLLGRVPELVFSEPERSDECCGFGGTFATTFPELSIKMGHDRIRELLASGDRIDGVVSADCSCMLHLQGLAPADMPFFHIAEVLLEAAG